MRPRTPTTRATPDRASRRGFAAYLLLPFCLLASAGAAHAAAWSDNLQREVQRIDRDSPGTLGVYVKRLNGGETFSYGSDKFWYLGSTVKVPIAIALLQQVDAGKLKLTDTLKLQDTDRIEAGRLVWSKTGTALQLGDLLKRMLGESDNTAANMLIRAVGEDKVNETARAAMGTKGFEKITTLAQVRYDVYAEIHPDARKLPNTQMVQIAGAPLGPGRVEAVRKALNLKTTDLKAKTIDEAYDRYYKTNVNSATLEAYGDMLEKLVKGQLLKPPSTQLLFTAMKIDIFTNYRLQAGLPRSEKFIHKTGTQYRRACHVGVINPQNGGADAIVVTTCAADLDEQKQAGRVFQQVGQAITKTMLTGPATAAAR
ncbi:MAG: serine hydrolase [Comamonadaceae bacterium]|nr:MAG: serine hydrolase [Comamonadaceae bacterium]